MREDRVSGLRWGEFTSRATSGHEKRSGTLLQALTKWYLYVDGELEILKDVSQNSHKNGGGVVSEGATAAVRFGFGFRNSHPMS